MGDMEIESGDMEIESGDMEIDGNRHRRGRRAGCVVVIEHLSFISISPSNPPNLPWNSEYPDGYMPQPSGAGTDNGGPVRYTAPIVRHHPRISC